MVTIDITPLQNMTEGQIINWSNHLTTIPSLLILYISTLLSFLIIGLISVKNRKKYMMIWILSAIISGILVLALIYLPNFFLDIVNFLKNLFS